MGKASNAKKVNRAAATGGGRTAGRRAPVGWYTSIFVIVVLGVLGVLTAYWNGAPDKAAASVPPRVNKDHWHSAYGFNLCGKWAAALQDGPAGDTTGIHTHADGLVHVHPFLSSVAGKNATFSKFEADTGAKVTATSVNLNREGERFKNGDKCGSKPGVVTARVFKNLEDKTGKAFDGDPSKIPLKNGELITISFNPKGTKLTQPPSAANITDPGDLGTTPTSSGATATTTTPSPSSSTSTP